MYNRCVAEGVKNLLYAIGQSCSESKMVVNKKLILTNEERASRECRWVPGGRW